MEGFILIKTKNFMKNTKTTTEYFKLFATVLIAMVFSISLPCLAYAQYSDMSYDYSDYGYSDYGYSDFSYDYGYDTGYDYSYDYSDTGYDYSYDYPDVSYDYADVGYDYTDMGYDYSDYYTNTYDYTGGYYGGNYYNYGLGFVTSGGYSGGTNTYTGPATYSVPPPGDVTSGIYAGGTNTYVAPTGYDVASPGDVTSGIYAGGTNTYVEPYSYYTQPYYYSSQPSYYSQPTLYSNQVLAYTDTNPSLESIYLSDIPNTGFEDYSKTIIFISVLLFWSAILAYMFLKRKIESQKELSVVAVNTNQTKSDDGSVSSNFLNKITSDNSDIRKVEEYARINKILLSSDASMKLVKLSRLGQINVAEYIKNIAKGEWLAVGASQIK